MKSKEIRKRAAGVSEYAFNTSQAIIEFSTLSFYIRKKIIEDKISKAQLVQLKEVIDLEYMQLAQVLCITDRTLYLKKSAELFSQAISNNIIAIVDLYSFGYIQFDYPELFNKWMKSLNPYMNLVAPLDYCHHFIGRDEVKNEILRIKDLKGELFHKP